MNNEKSGLGQLCTVETEVYGNYYSRTYRADFMLDDISGTWDIHHISLPFTPLKEKELMARFGITKEDLESYYVDFGRCVKNYLSMTKHLAEAEVDSVVSGPYFIEKKPDGARGSDIYLVTAPMQPISEWLWNNDDGTATIENIINLGTRLCQISKGINDAGGHFGIIDLDSVYIIRRHERDLVTMGGFLYANREGEPPVKLPCAVPAHAHPALLDGGNASLATDIYSICSLLWALLNGDHYTTNPDLSVEPAYAPEGIVDALRLGLDHANVELGQDEMLEVVKSISKTLHKVAKQVRAVDGQESPNNIAIPMAEEKYDLSAAYQHTWKFSKPKFAQEPAPTPTPVSMTEADISVTEEEVQAFVERFRDTEKMKRYFGGEKFPEYEGITVTEEEIESELARRDAEKGQKAVDVEHLERVHEEAVKRGLIPETRPAPFEELSEEEIEERLKASEEDIEAGRVFTKEEAHDRIMAHLDERRKQSAHWELLKRKAAECDQTAESSVPDTTPVTEEEIQALVERYEDHKKMERYFAGEHFPEFEGIEVTDEEVEAEFAKQEEETRARINAPDFEREFDMADAHSDRVWAEAIKRGLIPDDREKSWDELTEEEQDQLIIDAKKEVDAGLSLTEAEMDAEMDAESKQYIRWELLKKKAAERDRAAKAPTRKPSTKSKSGTKTAKKAAASTKGTKTKTSSSTAKKTTPKSKKK